MKLIPLAEAQEKYSTMFRGVKITIISGSVLFDEAGVDGASSYYCREHTKQLRFILGDGKYHCPDGDTVISRVVG
ncbi:hypothetical protein KBC75_05500 [Candidatus Shapirobacteria bacterium]|nr:hypothetical protein [Candidatus Shapirobacteria bacterium]